MGAAREDCIWVGQCGQDCCEGCDDYSPIDSLEADEKFYREKLTENVEEYNKLILEFSDEEDIKFESRRAENSAKEIAG